MSPLTETFFNPEILSAICRISPSAAPNFVSSPLRSACRRTSWILPFFSAARFSSSARAKLVHGMDQVKEADRDTWPCSFAGGR